jgi:prepilin-type processing-associated H-X9-DG protein
MGSCWKGSGDGSHQLMRTKRPRQSLRSGQLSKRLLASFTRRDLPVSLGVCCLLVCVGVIEFLKWRRRAHSICCNCNLKQVGLAFRTWALDHRDFYPMAISNAAGGTLEDCLTGNTFRHFLVMSNELVTPKVLVCPNDSRQPATDFASGFGNRNVSYFVGIVSNGDNPQLFLSGDRCVTNGTTPRNGVLELTTNAMPGWTAELHEGYGNTGFADGSVQMLSTAGLQHAATWAGATNRLSLP